MSKSTMVKARSIEYHILRRKGWRVLWTGNDGYVELARPRKDVGEKKVKEEN